MIGSCFKKKVEEVQPVKSEPELPPLPVKDHKIVRYPRCNREMTARLERLWNTIEVRPQYQKQVSAASDMVMNGIGKYREVQDTVNIPWQIIGVIDKMEGNCDPLAVLHNGERIVGTNRKTTLVPAGRGPFTSWSDAAIDAIGLEGMRPAGFRFDVANALYYLTSYNGWGYENKGINTPYLWSYTNHYSKGKYVSDGKYDANAVSKQCGAVPILKALGWKPQEWI